MSEKKGTSGVDYSKVADRHVDDDRYEKHRAQENAPKKVSAQMDAVMRLMMGKEERTIAEKLADSNRPTWEQYKKDNQDKLDISGLDQKQMEQYRKELDEERDKKLNRGLNHEGGKKKKDRKKKRRRRDEESDESSTDESDDSRRHRKKQKKKKRTSRKKHRRRHRSDSSSSGEDSSDDDSRRKKHRKKKRRKPKKNDKKEGMDDGYRLSNFFTKGSESDD